MWQLTRGPSLAARQNPAMTFHADLHVHSKHSRATSRDLDLEHMAWWAARKGVGDYRVRVRGIVIHPAGS